MKKKILIIEDEEEICDNVRILLEEENYDVFSAFNGETGLAIANECMPDLIICDIMMPGIDGYEVLDKLNMQEKTTLIPFIFLTAKIEHKDLRKGMELGADDYLLKPFKSQELLVAVKTRLDKYQSIITKLNSPGNPAVSNPDQRLDPEDNIILSYHNSSFPVKVKKMLCISAENQYSRVMLENNRSILFRRPLSEWEKILPEKIFIRVHRSTIINIEYLDKIEKSSSKGEYRVFLNQIDQTFEVSRRYLKNIRKKT